VTTSKGDEFFDRPQISMMWIAKKGHRGRNALLGLAAGAGVGLGLGLAARSKPGQWEILSDSVVTGALTGIGALGGVLIGAIIPTGGWREVYRK
jgi:hypothetical protein